MPAGVFNKLQNLVNLAVKTSTVVLITEENHFMLILSLGKCYFTHLFLALSFFKRMVVGKVVRN